MPFCLSEERLQGKCFLLELQGLRQEPVHCRRWRLDLHRTEVTTQLCDFLQPREIPKCSKEPVSAFVFITVTLYV